ncbi:type II toxin-antitoxin system RelE/ParE family toxin [Pseudofrankia sp. BMG5.37]|uniref:type II toxin-antitoxin system RelE/ParE family toxin n=1 Tax=Pseudofrankia sp. BMG5.37 TaxID=3050035 RepID=UPI00289996DC|nr:type II toxin-antitoxin system RelE/ParE family toxin [Pseudofrankia sp. BMG5.37]
MDRIGGSKIHNLKELRPASSGHTEVRILFVFDYARRAVLLVGGDKAGMWNRWYDLNIPVAEERYRRWCDGEYDTERKWRTWRRSGRRSGPNWSRPGSSTRPGLPRSRPTCELRRVRTA